MLPRGRLLPTRQRLRVSLPVAVVLLVGLVLRATVGTGLAQPAPSPENLTQRLLALNAQYHVTSPADQARLLGNLLTVAATRQQTLAGLIESDPGAVLRLAVPAGLRAALPPAVQAYVEEETALEGVLLVLHEDWPTGGRYRYFLDSIGGRYSLYFAAHPPVHLLTGSRVRVRGVRVGTALALDSGSTSVQTLGAAAVPNSSGAQKTLVILVNFQDTATEPYAVSHAQSVVFGTTSNFFLENSYQQTWLSGDVYGWYTIALDSTVCDQLKLASYAKSAATAAGADLSAYTRYVYAFPQNACGWWGAATVGGSPSQSWINGKFELKVVGHEMGHNLGLEHSHSLVCNDGTTIGPSCTTLEYGDGIDIMGWSPSAHFNAFQKERLGWLNYGASPPITTVQTDSTYVLDPYEAAGSNPKALKILKSTNPTTGYSDWYYVEFRQAIGFDSIITSGTSSMDRGNLLNGVVIHMGSEDNGGNSNALLDMTPETYQLYTRDPALVVGRSFFDPESGVTMTTLWTDGGSAGVSVIFSQPSCARANPTMGLSPSESQWVPAGTPVTYTVPVTNSDGAGCTASTFALQATVPGGWMAAFADPTLTLSPGASASTTLAVTSPASATDGFYTIGVTATNSGNPTSTGAASATHVIISSLNVTASTDRPSYTRNQSVSIMAMVSSGGLPVANATVTFAITKSNGAVVTATATTGTNGSAVYKLRLKRQDPIGAYQVRAAAANNGLSGSAATSFTVQ